MSADTSDLRQFTSPIVVKNVGKDEVSREGDAENGAMWSDVSVEGSSSVLEEDRDVESDDNSDEEEGTLSDGHSGSDREDDKNAKELVQGVLEKGQDDIEDGAALEEEPLEEVALEEVGPFDSGSEIGLSSSDDEDESDNEEERTGVTGDSASETYYNEEDDLALAIRDNWTKNEDLKAIRRVYESSCSESSDEEVWEGGEDENDEEASAQHGIYLDKEHEEHGKRAQPEEFDIPEEPGELEELGKLEEPEEKSRHRIIASPSNLDVDEELKALSLDKDEGKEDVVRWRARCIPSCTRRTDLERRLGGVVKLLSEFQLWTAERAADGAAASQKISHSTGRKGKQSEKARLRKEVEQLRVTLDYLTRMSLTQAVELQATIADR